MTLEPPKPQRHVAVSNDAYHYNGQLIHHCFDDYGNHAIAIEGTIGQWTWHKGIARNGPWAATTDYYSTELPRLFRVVEVKP